MSGKNPFTPTEPGHQNAGEVSAATPDPALSTGAGAAPATERPRQIEPVPRAMWTIAGFLLLLLLLGLASHSLFEQKAAKDALHARLAAQEQTIASADRQREQHLAELAQAKARIEALTTEAADALQAKEAATSAQRDLETEMRAALASKDVTITELQGRLTLNILDRILFDSGQALIKPDGQDVLRKLAAVLDQFPDRQIHVAGHTDNVPIHTAQFPSNWELSAARALAAVRFLVEDAGVNPARLAAVASGEHQPVADNATAAGRAMNRRIAIVVLPEVFNAPKTPLRGPALPGSGD